jgi:hypothetical protein
MNDTISTHAPPAPTHEIDKSQLEASEIIVYDPKAIAEHPKIYQSTSTAMVRFEGEQVDTIQHSRDGSSSRSTTHDDGDISDKNCSINSYVNAKDTQNKSSSSSSAPLPKSASEDVSSKIHIPHFLSWATNSKSARADNGVISESSIEYIEKILDNIHDTLMDRKAYQHKKIYRRTREISQGELHLQFSSFQDELTTSRTSETSVPTSDALGTGDPATEQRQQRYESAAMFDIVHQSMISNCILKVKNIWKVFFELLALFIPLSSPSVTDHTLVRKCCGALSALITVSNASTFGV